MGKFHNKFHNRNHFDNGNISKHFKKHKKNHEFHKHSLNSDILQQLKQGKSVYQQLAKKKLKIVQVDGDGNCLFRSCADQLYGDENKHFIVRNKAIEYMRKHPQDFEPFMETDKEPFQHYLSRMSHNGSWGGNLELQAISQVYHYNVIVYQDYHPNLEMQNFPDSSRILHIIYLGYCHYNSVRSLDGSVPSTHLSPVTTNENIVLSKNSDSESSSSSNTIQSPMIISSVLKKNISQTKNTDIISSSSSVSITLSKTSDNLENSEEDLIDEDEDEIDEDEYEDDDDEDDETMNSNKSLTHLLVSDITNPTSHINNNNEEDDEDEDDEDFTLDNENTLYENDDIPLEGVVFNEDENSDENNCCHCNKDSCCCEECSSIDSEDDSEENNQKVPLEEVATLASKSRQMKHKHHYLSHKRLFMMLYKDYHMSTTSKNAFIFASTIYNFSHPTLYYACKTHNFSS